MHFFVYIFVFYAIVPKIDSLFVCLCICLSVCARTFQPLVFFKGEYQNINMNEEEGGASGTEMVKSSRGGSSRDTKAPMTDEEQVRSRFVLTLYLLHVSVWWLV